MKHLKSSTKRTEADQSGLCCAPGIENRSDADQRESNSLPMPTTVCVNRTVSTYFAPSTNHMIRWRTIMKALLSCVDCVTKNKSPREQGRVTCHCNRLHYRWNGFRWPLLFVQPSNFLGIHRQHHPCGGASEGNGKPDASRPRKPTLVSSVPWYPYQDEDHYSSIHNLNNRKRRKHLLSPLLFTN